jgi:tetratricopeptide (TPR) repeat protein
MTGAAFDEDSLAEIAKKALSGEKAAAAGLLAGLLVTAVTGQVIAGAVAGVGIERWASALVDRATERLAAAEREYDAERERVRALVGELRAEMAPLLMAAVDDLDMASNERFLQTLRYISRNVAAADVQGEMARDIRRVIGLLEARHGQSNMGLVPVFEGPGRVPSRPVPYFTAPAELVALRELLGRKGESAVVLIQGMGGVGKTTLARELVARHGAELFPDGVSWLDGRDLEFDIARVARRLGWSSRREATPDEARAFLEEQLHARRILLVVDNLDLSQTDPRSVPVPGGSSRVLLTSRDTTVVQRLEEISSVFAVERWDVERARKYLRAIEPSFERDSDDSLDALCELVGGLPLALALLAKHPARDRGLGAADLRERIAAKPIETLDRYPGLAGGVVQTFAAATDALEPISRTVLSALAVCAGGTNTNVIASVAGVSESVARQGLNLLADRSLAIYRAESDAPWGIHDVIRLFVEHCTDLREFEQAHKRWVEEHLLEHADPAAFALFDGGVAEALRVVERLLRAGLTAEAARIYFPIFKHLMRRGEFGVALQNCQAIVDVVPSGSEEHATWLCNLGECYRTLGAQRPAIASFMAALEMNRSLGRIDAEAIVLRNLGACHAQLGEFTDAVGYLENALNVEQQLGRVDHLAKILGNLGACYLWMKDTRRAIPLCEQSAALHQRLGMREDEATDLTNLATCFENAGEIERAISCAQQALALHREIGRRDGEVVVLLTIGSCYATLKDFPSAIANYEHALTMARDLRLVEREAIALGNIGAVRMNEGRRRDAEVALERALALLRRMGFDDNHPPTRTFAEALRKLRAQ